MKYSLEQLNAMDEFANLVEKLEVATQQLREPLLEAEPVIGKVFRLPRVLPEDEEKPILFVEPEALSGDDAFRAGLAALDDWYGVPGYSTKSVHRTPGALAFHTDRTEEIVAAAELCNQIKNQIKALLPNMGNRYDRFEMIRARFHMMVLLQLTRQLLVMPCPRDIRSVTFTWGFKTEIFKLSIDQACEILESYRNRPVETDDGETPWSERLDREINKIRSLPPGTELRHRRPLKVRPMANIRYVLTEQERLERQQARVRGERVNEPIKLYEAHTPFIILNPPPQMTIGDLGTFDAEERKKRTPRRGLKTASDPITGIAPIYLVRN